MCVFVLYCTAMISNHPVTGSIIVNARSVCVAVGVRTMYGPIKSTLTRDHGSSSASLVGKCPYFLRLSSLSNPWYLEIKLGLNGRSVSLMSFSVKKIWAILSFVGLIGNFALKFASNLDKASVMTFFSPFTCRNVGPNSYSVRSLHRIIRSVDIFWYRRFLWFVCTISFWTNSIFLNSLSVSTMDNSSCSPVV